MCVRTRFAPSPTGFLHVGGVRTALFSWLYARHHQGEFILRIEDTDRERSTLESVQAILEGMQWLGLNYDEGPIHQTDRYSRYHQAAQQCIESGHAYRCYCSHERLENLRETQLAAQQKPRYDGHCRELNLPEREEPFVVRFKNPTSDVVCFTDLVYGEIQVDNRELDDFIMIRSDGFPTYNFAVVIDDWDMQITHVIRGDDHINNTPRQINLFRALQAPLPTFAHLPMILGEDGKRLSKRHGAVSVLQFKEAGILPHALLNYLVRLGWSYGDQEIFSLAEMINLFELKNVSRSAASFNYDKLYWLNQYYQKHDSAPYVASALAWHFVEAGIDVSQGPALEEIVKLQAERCKTLAEMCEKSQYFYQDEFEYDLEAVKKHWHPEVLKSWQAISEAFVKLEHWEQHAIHQCLQEISAKLNLNFGKIAQPLRIAVTGSTMSPSIDLTLQLIGKSRVLARLERALREFRESADVGNISL